MFYKNLKALEKVNKSLAIRISKIRLEDAAKNISVIKNDNGEFLLTKGNNIIDDSPSPIKSSEKMYSEQIQRPLTRHDIIVIYGLGFGNLLDYVSEKSVSNIVLYEPDLEIIRFTMEYVDLTKYFDGRLYLTNNLAECSNYIKNKYLIGDKIECLYIKNYLLYRPSEFSLLTKKIADDCHNKIIDINTISQMSKVWIENIFSKIRLNKNLIPLNLLKNCYKGKTALILGAGPSLKDNISKIKENRDKFVIFTIHRTLEVLQNNDIVPDFCVVTDAMYTNAYFPKLKEEYVKSLNLVLDIKSDKYTAKLPCKRSFIFFTNNSIFSEKMLINSSSIKDLLETVGTSTLSAYNCAKFLGCKNFIFTGVDLAFKDNTAYCDGKNVVTISQSEVKIQNISRHTTQVKSVTGDYVKTREDYASFISQFEAIFAKDQNPNIYNLTDFGAYIKGMKYDSLDNIIKYLKINKINAENVIEETLGQSHFSGQKFYQTMHNIFADEYKKTTPILKEAQDWLDMYSEHPQFYEYASTIITKITSTMMLEEYIQVELLEFLRLIYKDNESEKREFLIKLFTSIIQYGKQLKYLIED